MGTFNLQGVVQAQRLVAPERLAVGLSEGLSIAGEEFALAMKDAASVHTWSGRLEGAIHADPPVGYGLAVQVAVGIVRADAPEGAPLAGGWYSRENAQPPSGPGSRLADWAQSVLGDASLSYPIARAIHAGSTTGSHRGGYSFGKYDWFNKGISRARKAALNGVVNSIRKAR